MDVDEEQRVARQLGDVLDGLAPQQPGERPDAVALLGHVEQHVRAAQALGAAAHQRLVGEDRVILHPHQRLVEHREGFGMVDAAVEQRVAGVIAEIMKPAG